LNIQLALLPGQSSIIQSQVVAPGYVVEDPKAPKRSSSRLSRRKSALSQEIINSPTDPDVPSIAHRGTLHRRSTSQRLKTAHRRSLTCIMSALGRHPGSPPLERLPYPPEKLATESREALVSKRSIAGSICDSFWNRSLSSLKRSLGNCF
jgi:hypothetical protein